MQDTPLLLDLEFARADNADDPFAFRFGAQPYVLRRAGGRFESVHFDWSPEVLADLQAVRLPDRDPVIAQRLGELLRRFLQSSDWGVQEAQLLAAIQQGRRVILTVRSAAAEIYALPWELLALRDSGQQLGALPSLLLRYEWPASESAARELYPQQPSGRILFAWSAAGGAVPAAEQIAAIAEAASHGNIAFDPLQDVLPRASLATLNAQLQDARSRGEPIAVLHLLCHGTTAGQAFALALDDDGGGQVSTVDAGRLRQIVQPFAGMLRLVVLTACDSGNTGSLGSQLGSLAQTLHRAGVAQVIASRFPLSVVGASRFTAVFYRELLVTPSSSESAFLVARQDVALDASQLDWASLQIYARAEDGSDSRPLQLRPYRGLLSFQPEHQRWFFGRDAEVAQIVAQAQALAANGRPRLLAVDGASGSGKSSVVLAGALPKLLNMLGQDATYRRLRPGNSPLQALDAALADHSPTTPRLLIVDQLEELFTQTHDVALRRAFAQRLFALVRAAESGVWGVLTLRSDFVGHCGELVIDDHGLRLDRVIYEQAHRVSIAQMNPDQLREVMVRPAEQIGLQLESGLVERMLHDVESEPGALPLLADTLDLLWQRRAGRLLTQAAYDAIGGVTGALHRRADQQVAALTAPEQEQARRLLLRLGSGLGDPGRGVRLRLRLADRRPSDAAAAGDFDRMVAQLAQARIIVLDREGRDDTVEVAHEALLRKWPRLAQWAKEDSQLNAELDAVEAWVQQAMQQESLLVGAQLERTAALIAHRPDALSQSALALFQRSQAEQAQRDERDRFARDCLRMLAVTALDGDVTRQAAILREVESQDPSAVPSWLPYAVDLLQTGILTHAVLEAQHGAISAGAFSPDGTHIAVATQQGGVCLFNRTGGAPTVLAENVGAGRWVDFSHDGKRLLVASADGTARVYFLGATRPPLLLRGHGAPVVCAIFRPQTTQVATAAADGSVRLWDDVGQPTLLRGHRGAVHSLAFSRDGSLLASACDDGIARVYALDDRDTLDDPDALEGHDGPLRSVQLSPTATQGLTTSQDGSARLWDAQGRSRVLAAKGAPVTAATFRPDGQRVAVGLGSGAVLLFDLQGKTDGVPILSGDGAVMQLCFSPDGAWLAARFAEDPPAVCRADQRGQEYWLSGHLGAVTQLLWSPDSRWLVSLAKDGTGRVHDLTRPGLYQPSLGISDRDAAAFVQAAATASPLTCSSPDGMWTVTSTPQGGLRIAPRGSANPMPLPSGHLGPICGFDVSSDGKRAVIGGQDGRARVYRLDAAQPALVLEGHRDAITVASFSPSGDRILTMSKDGTTRLWRDDGRCDLLIDVGDERGVAVRRDWKGIVTERPDKLRQIWLLELDPRELIARLWRATPYCLSIVDRQRHLRETAEQSQHNHAHSRRRIADQQPV